MTVSRDEFLRRFLLHLLPKGFVRIRHFGFLANRRRAALLPRCFAALHASSTERRIGNLDRTQQRSRCGAVPSAADRWPSSNDSQPHNSNSVLHRSWPRLHEITRPHTALSARFRASRRSVSPLPPDIFFLSPPRLTSAIDSSLHRCAGCCSSGLDDSRELLHLSLAPFNLHKSRVRRASGFLLTAFSNATPHIFFQP